jgi:hypothetical protein
MRPGSEHLANRKKEHGHEQQPEPVAESEHDKGEDIRQHRTDHRDPPAINIRHYTSGNLEQIDTHLSKSDQDADLEK